MLLLKLIHDYYKHRVLPKLETKAEQVDVVWAEFVTTSNIWNDTSKEN